MQEKKRLDLFLFENGYAESREKAKALIMAGIVYINNQKCDKPGQSGYEQPVHPAKQSLFLLVAVIRYL